MKKIAILLLFLCSFSVFSQDNGSVDMADKFRSDGKIYVVVAVIAVILSGIFFYLYQTEKRLDKIEKK